ELLVHRLELLVRGLELLVDRLELLVRRLELLVRRLELLVRRLELLVRRLELLDGRLQLLVGRLELATCPGEPIGECAELAHVDERDQGADVAGRRVDERRRLDVEPPRLLAGPSPLDVLPADRVPVALRLVDQGAELDRTVGELEVLQRASDV